MKNYAVFYTKEELRRQAWGGLHVDAKNGPMALPRSEFDKGYGFVGVHQAEDLNDLFALLNDAKEHEGIPNPLGDPRLQELVVRPVEHTSMSVGDVAVDLETGVMHYCASLGWAEMELV